MEFSINCKYFPILNRKRYHSINVQGVCDANGKFIHFTARWPGSTHDAFILRNSLPSDTFESGRRNGIILADSGYPNRNWLFTPYRNSDAEWQVAYDTKHIRTRVVIENAFGRLKRRFAILHSEARLTSHKVAKVVAACIILHNIATDYKIGEKDTNDIEYEDHEDEQHLPSLDSSQCRDAFARNIFG